MPRKEKCFSTCRKRSKTECDHPMCRYNDGRQYKYCRLKHAYKMNAACEPVLRELKGKSKRKATTQKLHSLSKSIEKIILLDADLTPINNPKELNKSPPKVDPEELKEPPVKVSEEEIREFRERVKKANATRKIKKFMKKHQNKRRAHFLKAICSDADVCMAFGTEASKIRKHFDNFNNFKLISKPIKTIGAVSANGFVKDLTYENDGYVANAILKSSAKSHGDNLLYEGLVGEFLNDVGKVVPCFVETYGIYKYTTSSIYNEMKSHKSNNPFLLEPGLEKFKTIEQHDLNEACKRSLYMAVLIQHLNDVSSIGDKLHNKSTFVDFVSNDLLYILFQIYFPLSMLGTLFTHYDLHTNNVLLYEPVKGKYIEYHYHNVRNDAGKLTTVSFKSKYIAKIIDYGRCYFDDVDGNGFTKDSKSIYNAVCATKDCNKCGNEQGFGWLEHNPKLLPYNSFICSQIPNVSHDLRLLYIISKYAEKTGPLWNGPGYKLVDLLNKVEYGKGVKLSKEKTDLLATDSKAAVYAGTRENDVSGLPSKINNVMDASHELQRIIINPYTKMYNDAKHVSYDKLGDLHIFGDKPMQFIPM